MRIAHATSIAMLLQFARIEEDTNT